MRRSRAFRLLAGILALWTPLITGAVSSLPSCPMHGHAMHGDMTGMAMPTEQSAARSDAPGPQAPAQDQHPGCTCVCCCPVASATLRAPDAPTVDLAYLEISWTAESNPDALLRSAPEFARPYGRGPPRA